MNNFWNRGAALLCLPVAAMAQTSAADPAAVAPTVLYRSVFVDTPKGVETESLDWRTANNEVAKNLRGHNDIVKWEAAQAKLRSAPAGSQVSPGAAKP